jgi:hypothetical protein
MPRLFIAFLGVLRSVRQIPCDRTLGQTIRPPKGSALRGSFDGIARERCPAEKQILGFAPSVRA